MEEMRTEDASPVQFMDLRRNSSLSPLICYAPTMTTMHGFWRESNPLDYSIPLFLLQLMLIISLTRATSFLLRPLRQPRYISEVIGGVLLGPSVMGKIPNFAFNLFPLRSVVVLEAMAQIGLIYAIFTIGIEIELSVVKHVGAIRAMSFAGVSSVVPFTIGCLSGFVLHSYEDEDINLGAFVIFIGVSLSITAFSVLIRILAELKLLSSDVGRLVISSVIVVDSCCWISFVLTLTLQLSGGDMLASLWTLVSGSIFLACSFAIMRPAVWWVMHRTPEGEDIDEFHACILLAGVMVWAFIADMLGTHAVYGAFIYGLAIPNGPVGEAIVEKVEQVVESLLLPLFYAISGLRTNISSIRRPGAAIFLILVVLASGIAKIAGSLFLAYSFKMPLNDGLSHGLLMNTRGIIELAILNIGRDKHVIGDQTFTVLVFMSIIVTAMVYPSLSAVMRTSRRFVSYKRRTIQWSRPETELRVLVCVHTTRQVPAIIGLLEVSNPMKRSPIFVYALHLIELTGRATSMLILSTKTAESAQGGKDSAAAAGGQGRLQTQSDHIMNAFESYEQHAGGVNVQPLTAFSPYATMHEDVCTLAQEKHANLIILPFHKHQTVDGDMEVTHPALRSVNQNVLTGSPCSVSILIDRGLAGGIRTTRRVAVFFFGGPDDREALAFAGRVAGNPSVGLTVLRFIERPTMPSGLMNDERVVNVMSEDSRERQLDDELVNEFRRRCAGISTVEYVEKSSGNAEETVAALRLMEEGHDLFIVGRRQSKGSMMTAGMTEWSECPELGPIGDFLASSDFGLMVSVLVVQQCSEGMAAAELQPDSPRHVRLFMR